MKTGFQYRIAKPYHVVKKYDENRDEESILSLASNDTEATSHVSRDYTTYALENDEERFQELPSPDYPTGIPQRRHTLSYGEPMERLRIG